MARRTERTAGRGHPQPLPESLQQLLLLFTLSWQQCAFVPSDEEPSGMQQSEGFAELAFCVQQLFWPPLTAEPVGMQPQLPSLFVLRLLEQQFAVLPLVDPSGPTHPQT